MSREDDSNRCPTCGHVHQYVCPRYIGPGQGCGCQNGSRIEDWTKGAAEPIWND